MNVRMKMNVEEVANLYWSWMDVLEAGEDETRGTVSGLKPPEPITDPPKSQQIKWCWGKRELDTDF